MSGLIAALLFLTLVWVGFVVFGHFFKDVPLGPVNIRESDPSKMRANDQKNVAAQRRVHFFIVRRLWPLAAASFVAAVILLIVS